MADYLDRLTISPDARAKLHELAATSAASLLGMYYASRDAFVGFLGADETSRVVAQLEAVLGPTEVARLKCVGPAGPLGAMTDPASASTSAPPVAQSR